MSGTRIERGGATISHGRATLRHSRALRIRPVMRVLLAALMWLGAPPSLHNITTTN